MRKKLPPKLTPEEKAYLNNGEKIVFAVDEKLFLEEAKHLMALMHTMKQVLADLINDDYDVKLGLIYGFSTQESADHWFKVLQGPGGFWGIDVEYERQLFSKKETGLDTDHYAIYVRRIEREGLTFVNGRFRV